MKPIIRIVGVALGTLRAEYRQIANRYFGKLERFDGDAREVCQQILDKLWEGNFYRTSIGHFDFFWMRDFGTVCESLMKLGYQERVHHTLHWALRKYRRANIISTCIDSWGNCFDAPGHAIDSLPWLLHCIEVSHLPLNKSDVAYLEHQLKKYCKKYLNEDGSLKSKKVGEMRDAVIYDRSAYAVSLVGRMAVCVEKLKLNNFPFKHTLYRDELLNHYWNGDYFNADHGTDAFSAECALFPFYLNVVRDNAKLDRTLDYINEQKLNEPYPLVYTKQPEAFTYHPWMTAPFMPNYAGETVWSWFGEFYLHLLKRHKRPEYKKQYKSFASMIERHGNFPEMLNKDGSWYYAPIYRSDPGMVWVALFLEL